MTRLEVDPVAPTAPVFRPEALHRRAASRRVEEVPDGGWVVAAACCWAGVLVALGLTVAFGGDLLVGLVRGFFRGAPLSPPTGLLAVLALGLLAALLVGSHRLRSRHRVPVLLQMTVTECGAACLAMVLAHHGRHTGVSALADRLGSGRDGLSARALVEGARAEGLQVRAFSVAPEQLATVTGPAIVHWDFNHFLVCERWTPRRVQVIDPATGRRRMGTAEFERGFTGVVITCRPGVDLVRVPRPRHRWLRPLTTVLRQQRALVTQVLLASVLVQVLGLTLPLVSQYLVDTVLPRGLGAALPVLAVGLAVIVVSQGVLSYLRGRLLVALRQRLDLAYVPQLVQRLLALPFRFFEQRRTGDLIARVASVSTVRETLTGQAVSTVLDGALAVGYLSLVVARSWTLGSCVIALGAAQAVLVGATTRTSSDLTRQELAGDADAQSYLTEMLSGIATLKGSGTEDQAFTRWRALVRRQVAAGRRRGTQAAGVDAALSALGLLAPLVLLGLGALQVLSHRLSLGAMLATTALAAMALAPLASLLGSARALQLVLAHLERLRDIATSRPEQVGAVDPAPRLTGRIALDGVSFGYDPRGPRVLHSVSLRIEPGQKVAVVGRSGSGKSTLGKLLLALYDPDEGTIGYDGRTGSGLDRRSLRRQFGVVLQEPVLFSGSLRDNIAFGCPGASLAEVAAAARLADLDREIEAMPLGYETPLGEGGLGLSGGQRQRLALARAVLGRPAVLLLDEATSHLDVVTEAAVEARLGELRCTRIVIAHRLSTVRDADLIVVLADGRVVEQGTHLDLVRRGGPYAELAGTVPVRAQS